MRNKCLKLVSVLICILLFSAMLSSFDFAYAFMDYDEGEISLLQEGDYDIVISEKHSNGALIRSAEEKLYEGLLNCASQINIYVNRIPLSDAGALLSNVINDNPDLFYVSSSYRTSSLSGSDYVYAILPYYSMSKDEITSAKEIFDVGVQKALSTVDSSMNDMQKALTIHDYICDMTTYPDLSIEGDKEIYHSAYGFFYDGNVVCAGYTLAFSYLMHKLGIECEYVCSSGMSHAWNKIKLSGSWYNIDLTYDDYTLKDGVNIYGAVRHFFFLKSDSYFAGEVGLCHFDGKTYESCVADNTDMDEYFWDDVHSRIYVINGDYYYLDPEYSSHKAYLTKRTVEAEETHIGSAFVSATTNGAISQYDEEGNIVTKNYSDIMLRIAYLDGRFYVVSGYNIHSVSMTGVKYLITSISYYANGLSVRDNNLVYFLFNDNTPYYLEKTDYFESNITTSKGGYNNYVDINRDGYVNAKDYAMIIHK